MAAERGGDFGIGHGKSIAGRRCLSPFLILEYDGIVGEGLLQRPGRGKTMTAKSSKKKVAAAPGERVVSENRKARHNYTVLDTLECGLLLVGSEVKSLREGKVSLEEAYGRVKDDEVWLVGCDIPEYIDANRFNHRPKRLRKLLLHRREIKRFAHRALREGANAGAAEAVLQAGYRQGAHGRLPRQATARQAAGHEEGRGPAGHPAADVKKAVEAGGQGPGEAVRLRFRKDTRSPR